MEDVGKNIIDDRAGLNEQSIVVVRDGEDPPEDCLAILANEARPLLISGHELGDVIGEAEILFVWPFAVPSLQSNWARAKRLKWIQTATAGVDGLMFQELRESEVLVTNARGVFESAIAEYTLGLLLMFTKDLLRTVRLQQACLWRHRETARLGGARLLVVGAGPIGREVGRLAQRLGVDVEIVARRRREGDPDFGTVRAIEELHDALGGADFVVVVTPLTEGTRGLIDRDAIRAMKPGAYLINVGRGAVVDEDALLVGLQSGHLAGAALDVFEHEPLAVDHPFWSRPDVIVSPHMSADATGWQRLATSVFVENLRRWRRGDALLNRVDKRSGYGGASGAD
ncbi:MAG: D-2-hydroxyacid dehydrogenase [Ferrimicrobium sp.]|uniref:D-2-hydroxyacid dehydrogenase n=1 Tax=Ferrimicrobium acidiphilum TaxID=121039 RepID=A0ABV3XZM1_9ACTN|nr:D-2-hydroxyacid dehydrogenase [Ferrimicrobium sp.]